MGRKQNTLKEHCLGRHFTWNERLTLQYYYTGSNGYRKERSPKMLGKILQKSPRTIRRELQRGMVKHVCSDIPFEKIEYNADYAQNDAEYKMTNKGPSLKSGRHVNLINRIAYLIKEKHYSPYAVIAQLTKEDAWPKGLTICEKTLYNWIESGDITDVKIKDLPRKGKLKRSRSKGHIKHRRHNDVELANRSIEMRPKIINERKASGHWEGDTVYSSRNGGKACLFTLVERKTRFEIIIKLENRKAIYIVKAINSLERKFGSKKFREIFKSITFDNGVEFRDVSGIENSILTNTKRTELFFAHPYCSSERGTNENHNGIIRRFLPKKTNFAFVSKNTIKNIQDWMNNYPRKILNGFSPLELFNKEFNLKENNINLGVVK